MSKYTTELRWPIEQFLTDLDLENIEENWPHIFDKLGLSDYPIFDESYREGLNMKIIRHYYMREIGAETFALFRQYLRRTMFEIMPYYNKLYQSEILVIDPVNDIDMHYDRIWEDENDSSGTYNGSNSNRNIYQDTPMSLLNNDEEGPLISRMDYATNVTYDNGTDNNTTTGNIDRDGSSSEHEYGHKQNQADLLLKYRETFLNIDMMIINDLEICFFKLW